MAQEFRGRQPRVGTIVQGTHWGPRLLLPRCPSRQGHQVAVPISDKVTRGQQHLSPFQELAGESHLVIPSYPSWATTVPANEAGIWACCCFQQNRGLVRKEEGETPAVSAILSWGIIERLPKIIHVILLAQCLRCGLYCYQLRFFRMSSLRSPQWGGQWRLGLLTVLGLPLSPSVWIGLMPHDSGGLSSCRKSPLASLSSPQRDPLLFRNPVAQNDCTTQMQFHMHFLVWLHLWWYTYCLLLTSVYSYISLGQELYLLFSYMLPQSSRCWSLHIVDAHIE